MTKNTDNVKDKMFPGCPIRNVLSRISDKWSMLILYTLNQSSQPMRFSTLQQEIPDISQKMLTHTLRQLETDGLLSRKIYAEVPPRVEYALTDRGSSLLPCINILIDWAETNMKAILEDRERNKNRK